VEALTAEVDALVGQMHSAGADVPQLEAGDYTRVLLSST